MRTDGGAQCLGRDGLAASRPAGLYVDIESALCGSLFIPAALHQPWFSDDNQVLHSTLIMQPALLTTLAQLARVLDRYLRWSLANHRACMLICPAPAKLPVHWQGS